MDNACESERNESNNSVYDDGGGDADLVDVLVDVLVDQSVQ